MASNAEFSLNNLNTNPSFNFSNALYNSDFFRNTNGDENVDDSPYSNIDVHCNYFDENQFVNKYRNITNFSCLSLNIQSLPAKFNEFQEFINNLHVNNCQPDILCIQETWQITDPSLFPLNNYNSLICKLRGNSTQGGGVGLYFKNNL